MLLQTVYQIYFGKYKLTLVKPRKYYLNETIIVIDEIKIVNYLMKHRETTIVLPFLPKMPKLTEYIEHIKIMR